MKSARDWLSWALLSISLAAMLGACAPAGRPPEWERSGAAAIVRRAVAAHGGLERWRGFERVSFHYRESWSFPFQPANPWPENPIELDLALGLHDGSVEARPMPAGDWKPEFVLPRTHYMTLLPWKFLDEGARLAYTGREDGRDVVHVTFAASAGDTPRDRYWAYFDAETGRLERVILTVTAYGPLAVGDLRYEEYREVQGILVPSRIRALLSGPALPLHLGEYSAWKFE